VKHFHTDVTAAGARVTPQSVAVSIIGGTMGDSAAREGVTEAARRLSHALAEIAAVLDTNVSLHCQESSHDRAADKIKDTLKEWGVA
jgi:hypothetical protein